MTFTVEQAKAWAYDNYKDLDEARLACDKDYVQQLNRTMPDKSKELWDSGCWLRERLIALGATDEQIMPIQIAAGQRAFGRDAWQPAVDYANEFAATGDTVEKGGIELADKINRELFGEQKP